MSTLQERVASACRREPGIDLSGTQVAKLTAYVRLLDRWNRVHNLTGLRDEGALIERGLLDSLRAASLLPEGPGALDVGSGAGFPGIPLAVAVPARRWTLLEPRRKRCAFLEEVVQQLSLGDRVHVRRGRLEHLVESFELVTSRAVGEIGVEVERHLSPGGRWVVACTRETLERVRGEGYLGELAYEDHRCAQQGCWMSLLRSTPVEDSGGVRGPEKGA